MNQRLRRTLAAVAVLAATDGVADDGWQLLFAAVTHELTAADQQAIYQNLGLARSADGTQLLVMGGEDAGPATFRVQMTDLDADGHDEVFVTGGNAFLSGAGGSSVWLFTRQPPTGDWQMQLGVPANAYAVLARGDAAFPDLRLSGTGDCDSVWHWDGAGYVHLEDIATRPGACDGLP